MISEEELLAEVDRRNRRRSALPTENPQPNFEPLRAMIASVVGKAFDDGRWPKDYKQHIYEAAMEVVYGPPFWEWKRAADLPGA